MNHRADDSWDPGDPRAWASALGFAYVPLFAGARATDDESHALLLDGHRTSLHVVAGTDPGALLAAPNLRYAWSSHILHSVGLDQANGVVFLQRWDDQSAIRKFRFPSHAAGAEELVQVLKRSAPPPSGDVVLHMLHAFRAVRNLSLEDGPMVALARFNLLLLAAELVETSTIDSEGVASVVSFRQLAAQYLVDRVDQPRLDGLMEQIDSVGIDPFPGYVAGYFLEPEPRHRYQLIPSLLIRHALGQVYQEAHLTLELEGIQLGIPGSAPPLVGAEIRRDVRFTPRSLARSLAEAALRRLSADGGLPATIEILDPACGSGVFLIESLGVLLEMGYQGTIRLRGLDISPISAEMARFAVRSAAREAPPQAAITVEVSIEDRDALVGEWGTPDVILTNPPFTPWASMTAAEQAAVRRILGATSKGRTDKSMAFVSKAANSVRPHGIIASVLPAALLETESGTAWREALSDSCSIELLGRFEGFGYFRASFVEPSFVVLRRREEDAGPGEYPKVVVAQETFEDDALRFLRRSGAGGAEDAPFEHTDGWDAYVMDAPPSPLTWLPRRRSDADLMRAIKSRYLSKVEQLFNVHQGVRTGANDVFLLGPRDYEQIPEAERPYFRPVAGNSTIRGGQLLPVLHIFYPYGQRVPRLDTEDALARAVPSYFATRLRPTRERLSRRAGLGGRPWWHLTWPRVWQYNPEPKLVTTYFGDRGSFAFDPVGDYVVVQGHSWLWRGDGRQSPESRVDFLDTPLPWAYLAVANSQVFERLLAFWCPRVQGGQFNLSPRFVGSVPLPNLADGTHVLGEVVASLAHIGQSIAFATPYDKSELELLALRAYGLPASFLGV
jgi:adenine-specific DNA-methyltransferase